MEGKADKKQAFIELRAKSTSYDSIAKQIGVSKPTLIKWSEELADELSNYKAIEREALRELYLASKKHRIIIQGEQLKVMRKELAKRDFSDVPTYKLVELVTRLSDNLANDEEQIKFVGDGLDRWETTHQWVG